MGYLWVALAYVAWKLVRLSDEKKNARDHHLESLEEKASLRTPPLRLTRARAQRSGGCTLKPHAPLLVPRQVSIINDCTAALGIRCFTVKDKARD